MSLTVTVPPRDGSATRASSGPLSPSPAPSAFPSIISSASPPTSHSPVHRASPPPPLALPAPLRLPPYCVVFPPFPHSRLPSTSIPLPLSPSLTFFLDNSRSMSAVPHSFPYDPTPSPSPPPSPPLPV
ncbi:hypothetical protein EV715DRAFT_298378 [Schizophyllum commune]